ncbi:Uncharacterized protein GBIM_14419, partial [Gryllus bimaculatus]
GGRLLTETAACAESLGPGYGEARILDLEATWQESEPRTPLICILSIGSDPSPQVTALAKQQTIPLRAVSMGQGQELVARRMIADSMAQGGWVLLQNIHLSLPFCGEAMDALVDTERVHESFRLWMTTEVHPQFPIGLLQMAIKFTNEPPQGIRASLKRTYQAITQVWFCDVLLRPGFEFYKGYRVPNTRQLQGYVDYINQLPPSDTPEPKEGGGGGGETREVVVYRLAEDMLSKLPPAYSVFEVREALARMGALLPMNIFLRQEIDRLRRVLSTVRNTLNDLKLAIDGTIVMSQGLRASLDAMYDARIPDRWLKVSWESATLGFWYTELLERDAQFRRWCAKGRPNVFWMTGFFNPQGFLTAMRQEVTRANQRLGAGSDGAAMT